MAQRINTKVAQNCCQPVVGANTQPLVISLNLEVEAKPKPRPPNSPEVSRVFDGVSVEGKSFFFSEGQRATISEMFMAKGEDSWRLIGLIIHFLPVGNDSNASPSLVFHIAVRE